MKLKISFFNKTVFKKDLQRFAPAWGLYAVCLLMGYVTILVDDALAYYRASTIANLMPFMAVLNLGYGFLNAQLLFGDLFNTRLCNALHAMPLRRECWYGTHLASGITFSLFPNLVVSLLGLATLGLGKAWSVALWWLLASQLQYLFFFGVAVFCMKLTGNRFAATLIYGIVNFFALLAYWLIDSLYEPLLNGIRIDDRPFFYFSPMVEMTTEQELVSVLGNRIEDAQGFFVDYEITGVALGEGWGSLVIYALIGAALLGLALVMYRRRKLETAGDFTAFKFAEPVLLIIYTISAGGFLHLMAGVFGGGWQRYMFLAVGLGIGFFTGLMLLKRTTRVFTRKAFLRFGLFTLVFALTLVVTRLDPLGITRWVPKAEEVASVNLSSRYEINSYSEGELTLTDKADIANILAIHTDALEQNSGEIFEEVGYFRDVNFCLEYTMEDGSVRRRFYEIDAGSESGQLLKGYYSSFEYVTGYTEDQIPELAERVVSIYAQQLRDNEQYQEFMAQMDAEEMLRCIAADCAAGNMAQFGSYHMVQDEEGVWLYDDGSTFLEFGIDRIAANTGKANTFYTSLTVYADSVNTMNWMIENGLYDPEEYLG